MPLRRVLDIETVLSWAFRDEAPKLRSDPSGRAEPSQVSPMFRLCALGGRVDNWSREPGFPAALGAPHPDALRVVEAVNALDASDLDLTGWAAWAGGEPPGVDLDIMAGNALRDVVAIVTLAARSGERPYWAPDQAVEPKRGANGHPAVFGKVKGTLTLRDGSTVEAEREEVLPSRKRAGGDYPTGAYCKLLYMPGRVKTWEARAEYAAWVRALAVLVERLADLSSIRVTGSGAPEQPWENAAEPFRTGRVLRDESCGGLVARPPVRKNRATVGRSRTG